MDLYSLISFNLSIDTCVLLAKHEADNNEFWWLNARTLKVEKQLTLDPKTFKGGIWGEQITFLSFVFIFFLIY